MEKESKGSIPVLDSHVKKEGSKVTTSVCRKPTHTPKVKSGIVDCLHSRAEQVCKQDPALAEETNHVQNVLMVNDYPK